MDKFYIVWEQDEVAPAGKYHTRGDAENEARRMAIQFPPRRYVVLESIGHYIKLEVQWEEHE